MKHAIRAYLLLLASAVPSLGTAKGEFGFEVPEKIVIEAESVKLVPVGVERSRGPARK